MTYSITLLDRKAEWATVFVAPDRAVEVTRRKVVTNFQHHVEWPEHARATRAEERLASLQQRIDSAGPLQDAVNALLLPPLFQSAYLRGYGTLYSVVYRPHSGAVELLWPGQRWAQKMDAFVDGKREIVYASSGYALAGQQDRSVMDGFT
jgi:predicted choloylglycine hydrolase